MNEPLATVYFILHPSAFILAFQARVPGIGLLNRTSKSRAERHEVQLLRGFPEKRMKDEG
jgi:hypothetical protein